MKKCYFVKIKDECNILDAIHEIEDFFKDRKVKFYECDFSPFQSKKIKIGNIPAYLCFFPEVFNHEINFFLDVRYEENLDETE